MATTYLHVPYDPPVRPPDTPPCRDCNGLGISPGRRFQMPLDGVGGRFMLLDAFCRTCKGCGSASHEQCPPGAHALVSESELDELGETDGCPSCQGRGWWPATAWSANDPEPDVVTLLRVPCGCVEHRAQPVTLASLEPQE
jgi:hypothetical protein